MYSLGTLIITALAALLAGGLLGAWLFSRFAPEGQNRKALETHIQKLQEQQKDYQQQVNEHFNKTAELLNQMADSYREVHNHLANSAQDLTSTGISPLQPLPDGKPALTPEEEKGAANLQPPLDYAPYVPGSKGALAEDFGLEKSSHPSRSQPSRESREKEPLTER